MDVSCASGQLAVNGGGPNIYCSSVHKKSQVPVIWPPHNTLVLGSLSSGCSPFSCELLLQITARAVAELLPAKLREPGKASVVLVRC